MIYRSEMNSPSYAPPILGNGDLAFAVDCEGAVHLTQDQQRPMDNCDCVIYRAGRRLNVGHETQLAKILSFGKLFFDGGSGVESFEQELREKEGVVRSVCRYESGAEIETEGFIHPSLPLYCVQKTMLRGDTDVAWRYSLCGYDQPTDRAILQKEQEVHEQGGSVRFLLNGMDLYRGVLCLQTDRKMSGWCDEHGIHLCCRLRQGDCLTLCMYLEDDLLGADPEKACAAMAGRIDELGYEGLKEENTASWREYFSRGYVHTSDQTLNQLYSTALYHLRCFTTRWSIPVGLTNKHWDGKFFAFDEYYSFLGLLGANQRELARRVPAFRLEVCLEKAIARQTNRTEEQARFCWESSEYGTEVAMPGYWHEHIFHMAVIALGAYEYYEFSQDIDFLSRCYRMIRACAQFYALHMVYREGDQAYVARCTDLERLGSSVFNPFMTSCGVIRTFEVTAMASQILGIDEEFRAECIALAKGLRATLPVEDGRYVPYLHCPQKSIAVFAGKFPFDVLTDDDGRMHAAWQDFMENSGAYGNMYQFGSGISPWYACWEAEGFARAGKAEETYRCLQRAYGSAGVFGEMFEINEEAFRVRPWFTTASGIFLSAVNEMIVKSDGKTIRLLPACPLQDVSFRLAVKGGAVLEAEIRDGRLVCARLVADSPRVMRLIYRDEEMMLST